MQGKREKKTGSESNEKRGENEKKKEKERGRKSFTHWYNPQITATPRVEPGLCQEPPTTFRSLAWIEGPEPLGCQPLPPGTLAGSWIFKWSLGVLCIRTRPTHIPILILELFYLDISLNINNPHMILTKSPKRNSAYPQNQYRMHVTDGIQTVKRPVETQIFKYTSSSPLGSSDFWDCVAALICNQSSLESLSHSAHTTV